MDATAPAEPQAPPELPACLAADVLEVIAAMRQVAEQSALAGPYSTATPEHRADLQVAYAALGEADTRMQVQLARAAELSENAPAQPSMT